MTSCLAAASKCFSFIPRLVVHKAEVQRIFHPERYVPKRKKSAEENNESAEESDEFQTTGIEVRGGSIFLRGVIPEVAILKASICQTLRGIPQHMRTITVIAADLPSAFTGKASEWNSNLRNFDLPTTIINLTEGVEGRLETIVHVSNKTVNGVVELPHRASFEWKQLIWVLFLLVLAPAFIFGIMFFIPMGSVNAGVANNRGFIYGTLTFYQMLTMIPWIETCNFAMPAAQIPVKARLVTLILALVIAKIYDAILAEGIFGHQIFPLPFSLIVSGMIGVSGVVPLLYIMTPQREKANFRLMQIVLMVYWISLLIVIGWAVGIQRLMGRPFLQTALTFAYGPLRFVCKIMLAAPVTTNLNGNRWIQLNLVVDILFTRVQVATFPFIDSYVTLVMLFSTEVLTLAWRYYNGIDRLALWWNAVWVARAEEKELEVSNTIVRTMKVTKSCFRASIPHIAQMNLDLREKKLKPGFIVRTLTGETGFSLDEEASIPSSYSQDGDDTLGGIVDVFLVASIEEQGTEAGVPDIEAACDMADEQAKTRLETSPSIIPVVSILEASGAGATNEEHDALESGELEPMNSVDPNEDGGNDTEPFQATPTIDPSALSEEDWEQRPMYHVVDSTGALGISIIVRINQQLSISMVRNLPSSNHLNDSFETSDEGWRKAQIYGWSFIGLMILLLCFVGISFFRRLARPDGKKLSLSRVMSYLYKDHFWFFFLWLVSTGAFVCASMVNHFGADFSFRFQWISCPEQIAWPSCPSSGG